MISKSVPGIILKYNYKTWDTLAICSENAKWVPCMHFDDLQLSIPFYPNVINRFRYTIIPASLINVSYFLSVVNYIKVFF